MNAAPVDPNAPVSRRALRPLTLRLLAARGLGDEASVERFLQPRLGQLRPPEGAQPMRGFSALVDRLLAAVERGEAIALFGDYDVDGVTAAALLAGFLQDVGARVLPRVAKRQDGYGLRPHIVDEVVAAGARVLVVCDCGTNDREALLVGRRLGIDVLVIDHHQAPQGDDAPPAFALCNPHQRDCAFPYKGLASVGVAFYVAAALRSRLVARQKSAPDVRSYLDLVALGTIADMAPLTDENRLLVAHGLQQLERGTRPGVRALVERAELAGKKITSHEVGMRLGPRLNAPGRLGAAEAALRLLTTRSEEDARALAAECDQQNSERRSIQTQIFDEALEDAQAQVDAGAKILVVARQGWHHGVVGIVAGRLVERFARPALVLGIDEGLARGSGRSVSGLSLHAALSRPEVARLLDRFGGHTMAVGLTLAADRLPALRAALAPVVEELLPRTPPPTRLAEPVELGELDERQAEELQLLGPFGIGNPEPLLVASGLRVERARAVGADQSHLQISLGQGGQVRSAIGFDMGRISVSVGQTVEARFFLDVDEYRGERRVRLRLAALAPT